MGCWIRAIALVGGLMGVLGSPAALATPNPAKLQLKSGSALVMDVNTGKTLYQKNPAQVRPIASLTKLMTALVEQTQARRLQRVRQTTGSPTGGPFFMENSGEFPLLALVKQGQK